MSLWNRIYSVELHLRVDGRPGKRQFGLSIDADHVAVATHFHVGWMALVSFGVAAALITLVQPKPARTVPVLAVTGAGIYYWFAPELVVETLGSGSEMKWIIRFGFLTLVAIWLWNATGNGWEC